MTAAALGIILLLTQSAAVPEATIRGRVLDPDGRPLQDVFVIAELVDAERRRTAGQPGRSNAEGAFEIIGVPAGRMIIREHPPAFFPGVLDRLDAWPIDGPTGG